MTPERVIHILPEQVASQIAAGEVVERPASALKELVENGIDAGARTIEVELARGGGDLIAVRDDGCGMGPQDAILALRRHATSKIRDAADLNAIRTLGFRGEALAAIASVSRLQMRTRRSADAEGIEIAASGGEDPATRSCGIAAGTSIEVRDLFFNTPARLKFLKTPTTEQTAAAEMLQRLALSNYRIAFRLTADGRRLFDVPRAASALERFRQLFGAKTAERMLPFDVTSGAVRVWGLAASSQDSYGTPRLVLTFVNGRAVRDRALIRAVVQAYQTLLPRGRYPATALFVEMPPTEVDVNVHPMKSEVRFRNSGAVFATVHHAIRSRLADQTIETIPVAAEVTDVAAAAVSTPVAAAAALPNEGLARPAETAPYRPLRLVADNTSSRAHQAPLGLSFTRGAATNILSRPHDESSAAGAGIPHYSELKVVGQIFTGFIALESEDGLILVDQHAAHERVTFEKLRAELRAGSIKIQPMLTPATIELNPARAAQAIAALPELRAMGFEVEQFGATSIRLTGAPAVFGIEGGARLLGEMIDAMGDNGFNLRGAGAFDDCLKTLACHGSVRAGRTLRGPEITELLAALDRTEFKTNCPHGRPTHIEFRRGTIERMFRR